MQLYYMQLLSINHTFANLVPQLGCSCNSLKMYTIFRSLPAINLLFQNRLTQQIASLCATTSSSSTTSINRLRKILCAKRFRRIKYTYISNVFSESLLNTIWHKRWRNLHTNHWIHCNSLFSWSLRTNMFSDELYLADTWAGEWLQIDFR